MRSPCPVERNQSTGVHCTTKDILRQEISFIPSHSLFLRMSMFTFSNISEPFVISIMAKIAVFQPFVDQHVR